MKIALCHLELSCGPQERNLCFLEQAVRVAAEQGADWVLTPEVAVQGYYFYRIDENAVVAPQPSPELETSIGWPKRRQTIKEQCLDG